MIVLCLSAQQASIRALNSIRILMDEILDVNAVAPVTLKCVRSYELYCKTSKNKKYLHTRLLSMKLKCQAT